MRHPDEDQLPDELGQISELLSDHRPRADAAELDRIKARALTQGFRPSAGPDERKRHEITCGRRPGCRGPGVRRYGGGLGRNWRGPWKWRQQWERSEQSVLPAVFECSWKAEGRAWRQQVRSAEPRQQPEQDLAVTETARGGAAFDVPAFGGSRRPAQKTGASSSPSPACCSSRGSAERKRLCRSSVAAPNGLSRSARLVAAPGSMPAAALRDRQRVLVFPVVRIAVGCLLHRVDRRLDLTQGGPGSSPRADRARAEAASPRCALSPRRSPADNLRAAGTSGRRRRAFPGRP